MSGIKEFFWKRSGEDFVIIQHCNHKGIQDRFAFIGGLTTLVFITSFLSCWYSFKMLFDGSWMTIPVSLFFAWMINNIYEVLLTTLCKPVMPLSYQGVIKHLSWSLRIGFIVFFAVFISKPLEAWLFEPALSVKVAAMKQESIKTAESKLVRLHQSYETSLINLIRKKEALHYPETAIKPYRDQLDQLHQQQDEAKERIEFVIGKADFFVQRLQILTGRGIFLLSWLFTLLLVALFLLPVYLKSNLDLTTPYLVEKREIYGGIVDKAFAAFKKDYSAIFLKKYQATVNYRENYTDAPYNTTKATDQRIFLSQDEFLKRLRG